MYQRFPASQTGRRPYISDSGAMIIGAKLIPSKKIENMICPVMASMFKSRVMSPKAGATIDADIVVTSWLVELIMPIEILRREGQL